MLQRQGVMGADGNPVRETRQPVSRDPKEPRPTPRVYLQQVRSELKKVLWPTRPEVRNYTNVVIVTLLIMTALTFVLDHLFERGIVSLFSR
jgi:preprotein translocase subunit SecE